MTSPYLDKPLRTEAEAAFDVALHKLNVAAREFRLRRADDLALRDAVFRAHFVFALAALQLDSDRAARDRKEKQPHA